MSILNNGYFYNVHRTCIKDGQIIGDALLKVDLHGANIEVQRSLCFSLVGIEGIILQVQN